SEVAVVGGWFVDRCGARELGEEEKIRADLKSLPRISLRQRKCRTPQAHGEQVGDRRREGQPGIQEAKGVEGVIVAARPVAAERVAGAPAVAVTRRDDQFAGKPRLA